jgi:hypothetical protein
LFCEKAIKGNQDAFWSYKEVGLMAMVIRLEPGGSSVVEKAGLSLERAKELAARLAEVGEPPGCCWCVGLEEEDDEEAG